MKLTKEHEVRRKFRDAIGRARTERFERGSFSAADILQDVVAVDPELWAAIQYQLATQSAIDLIKRLVRKSPLAIDSPNPKLFEDIPPLIVTDHGWVAITRATLAQLRWYADWYDSRLRGSLIRSERETATLEHIRHLQRTVEAYAGKDDSVIVEDAIQGLPRSGRQ